MSANREAFRLNGQDPRRPGHIRPGPFSAALDRLERAGYVRRVRDEKDRRRVLVEVTDRLEKLTWELYGPLATSGDAMLRDLTEEHLTIMRDVMREAARLQMEQAHRVRKRSERQSSTTR